MKKMLSRFQSGVYHVAEGKRCEGPPSGVTGDLTGVTGDLDDCEISEAERAAGVDVSDLIA